MEYSFKNNPPKFYLKHISHINPYNKNPQKIGPKSSQNQKFLPPSPLKGHFGAFQKVSLKVIISLLKILGLNI